MQAPIDRPLISSLGRYLEIQQHVGRHVENHEHLSDDVLVPRFVDEPAQVPVEIRWC